MDWPAPPTNRSLSSPSRPAETGRTFTQEHRQQMTGFRQSLWARSAAGLGWFAVQSGRSVDITMSVVRRRDLPSRLSQGASNDEPSSVGRGAR
jgi:hypothetical protein